MDREDEQPAHPEVKRQDVEPDYILGANDVVRWAGIGVLVMIPMVVVDHLGWPSWTAVPVGTLGGLGVALRRHHVRRRTQPGRDANADA